MYFSIFLQCDPVTVSTLSFFVFGIVNLEIEMQV